MLVEEVVRRFQSLIVCPSELMVILGPLLTGFPQFSHHLLNQPWLFVVGYARIMLGFGLIWSWLVGGL